MFDPKSYGVTAGNSHPTEKHSHNAINYIATSVLMLNNFGELCLTFVLVLVQMAVTIDWGMP
jgi:hypothetical protein